jgi:RNA polymerase sigma factor (sigma-70 family)
MAVRSQTLLDHVRRLTARMDTCADAVLLERFARQRDSAAFEALMHRHGSMVLGVCRRLLGNDHDAEDVFQATFLALARKAADGSPPDSLPAWLHGTAHRLSLKHHQTEKRRQNREARTGQAAEAVPPSDPSSQLTVQEMFQALNEELLQLPEINRLPLILCYLEGRTQDEAAEMLGWTPGSLRGRLQRGREMLQTRMARRGLSLGMGLLTTVALGESTATAMPTALTRATVEAALRFAAGGKAEIAAGALVEGAQRAAWQRLTVLFGIVLAVSVGGVLASQIVDWGSAPVAGTDVPSAQGKEAASHVDRFDDPLPDEALARMGTTRLRHTDCVNSVLFAPDGTTIVSGGGDDTLRLWDAASGKLVRTLKLPDRMPGARPLSFGAGGQTLVTASATADQLWLWDLKTGDQPRKIDLKQGANLPLKFAAISSGKTVASGDKEGVIHLWDVSGGTPLRLLKGHGKSIRSLTFSPNNQTLASMASGNETEVWLWDVATGKLLLKLEQEPRITTVSFSPDGKIVALGGGKPVPAPFKPERGMNAVRLWDTTTGRLLRTLEGHEQPLLASCFSPDGKLLASGSLDQTIRLWDAATGKELRKWKTDQYPAQSLSFSADSKLLAVGSGGPAVHLWDVTTGEELQRPEKAHKGQVNSVAFSPDGKILATAARGGGDNTIRLWEAASGKPIRWLRHPGEAHAVAFALDGKTLASGGADVVCLWDVATGKLLRKLDSQGGWPLAFCPNGKLLAPTPYVPGSAPSGTTMCLWDVTTGNQLSTPTFEHPHITLSAGLSSDGKVVAVRTAFTLRLWDVATGRELLKSDNRPDPSAALSLSPDGKTIAVGDTTGKIRLLDASKGNTIHTLAGHGKQILSLAFSPNGRWLASGSNDQTVQLWEVSTGLALPGRKFSGHQGPVRSLIFSPDGRRLASGSDDSTALVWDVSGLAATSAVTPTRDELNAHWDFLKCGDAARAHQAMCSLAAAPEQAVPFLEACLLEDGRQKPDAQRVARLLAELNSEDSRVRSSAAGELGQMAETIEPALRQALKDNPSSEARQCLQQMLEALYLDGVSLPALRRARALEVLEWINSPSARELLKKLAADSPREDLSREAKAVLGRLSNRPNS